MTSKDCVWLKGCRMISNQILILLYFLLKWKFRVQIVLACFRSWWRNCRKNLILLQSVRICLYHCRIQAWFLTVTCIQSTKKKKKIYEIFSWLSKHQKHTASKNFRKVNRHMTATVVYYVRIWVNINIINIYVFQKEFTIKTTKITKGNHNFGIMLGNS